VTLSLPFLKKFHAEKPENGAEVPTVIAERSLRGSAKIPYFFVCN
jgi:hypothetical protein